jgi:F-type H+-transporting ATPase subunit O
VLSALKANPNNEGKEFKLEFQIDSTIMGGLQMYTETEFMDMSLQSRLDKLKAEVGRFVE